MPLVHNRKLQLLLGFHFFLKQPYIRLKLLFWCFPIPVYSDAFPTTEYLHASPGPKQFSHEQVSPTFQTDFHKKKTSQKSHMPQNVFAMTPLASPSLQSINQICETRGVLALSCEKSCEINKSTTLLCFVSNQQNTFRKYLTKILMKNFVNCGARNVIPF